MTNDKLEEEIDKMYDEMFQKQAEMEELGLINYGDRSYYLQHPEEYKKDSEICGLESEVMRLEHKLEITEKALELACERVKYFEEMQDKEMGHFELFGYDTDYDLQAIVEQYKEQAKEMMKNE